jgi:hypothetical protein
MRAKILFSLAVAVSVASPAADAGEQHPAATTAQNFCAAVAAGEFERALALTVPKHYSQETLQEMKNVLRLDQAKVRETHFGGQQAAVITEEIAPRVEGQMRTGCWGVSLVKQDAKWLINDFDFLPNDRATAKYLARFHEQEPHSDHVFGAMDVSPEPPEDGDPARTWGPTQNGLRVELREIPNNYARGYLKLLALSLENVSDTPIRYDPRQVDADNSLIVRRNGLTPVEYRGAAARTGGEPKTIEPGTTVPLFSRLILEEQYDISQPGTYTVQFRGRAGNGQTAPIPASNIITLRVKP